MLLIHQVPPRPAYLRVKIGRHLQRLGAVAIKNSVYTMPASDEAQEDLQWVRGEITRGGGYASIVEARFVDGLGDDEVVGLFQAAREADYRTLLDQAREVARDFPRAGLPPENRRTEVAGQVSRLRHRLGEIVALDFFGAPGREAVEGLVAGLEQRMKPETQSSFPHKSTLSMGEHQGRTWVTRTGIKVDRMASAWLIRRFIDPKARFKFVAAKGYEPAPRELRASASTATRGCATSPRSSTASTSRTESSLARRPPESEGWSPASQRRTRETRIAWLAGRPCSRISTPPRASPRGTEVPAVAFPGRSRRHGNGARGFLFHFARLGTFWL